MKKIINGILMGISYIVPGLCSASMALCLGCYDVLIDLFGHFYQLSILKKHFLFLLGMVIGLVLAVFLFNRLYALFPGFLMAFFVGMIICGMPIKEKNNHQKKLNLFVQFLLWSIGAIIVLVINSIGDNSLFLLQTKNPFFKYLMVFFLAFFSSLALILPGISGAMLLLVFGLYVPILKSFELVITRLFQFQMILDENLILLGIFIIGFLIGILLFSKIIDIFMKRSEKVFTSISNGFVLGSIIIMVKIIVNHLAFDPMIFLAIILIFLGYGLMYFISRRAKKS